MFKFNSYIALLLFVMLLSCGKNSTEPNNDTKDTDEPVFLPQNGTWQTIQSPTSKDLQNIVFSSSQVGWANSLGTVIKTTDGGASWQTIKEITTPPYLNSIQFLNDQIGWVGTSDSLILKTTDGGTTWTTISVPERGCQIVTFINKNVGWVGGWGSGILKTEDAGTTWTKQLDIGEWERIQDIFFIDELNGWATCLYYWYGTGPEPEVTITDGYVFKTTDGGQNWIKIELNNDPFAISSIHFFDNNAGILNANGIKKSSDSGLSWHDTNSIQSSDAVFFIDNQYGWISGYDTNSNVFTIGVTTNGGETWEYMNDVIQDVSHKINSIFFHDSTNGWAVGNTGTILKYIPPVNN